MWIARAALLGAVAAGAAGADEIDDRIAELTSDDSLRRSAARDALRAHGHPIVPRLAAAAARSTDRRVHEMLYEMELVPEDDDGGLGASIAVDRTSVAWGEEFVVHVRLSNASPGPLSFDPLDGGQGGISSGTCIRVGTAGSPDESPLGLAGRPGLCAHAIPDLGTILDPGEVREVRYRFSVTDRDGRLGLATHEGSVDWSAEIDPGQVRVAYVLEMRDQSRGDFGSAPDPGNWKGCVRREVVVHVER